MNWSQCQIKSSRFEEARRCTLEMLEMIGALLVL